MSDDDARAAGLPGWTLEDVRAQLAHPRLAHVAVDRARAARRPDARGAEGEGVSDVSDAARVLGRRGGLVTRDRYGSAYFRRLAAVKNGRAGAVAQRESLGEAGMEQKARAGGEALLEQRGTEWFQELGRRSQAARRMTRPGAGRSG